MPDYFDPNFLHYYHFACIVRITIYFMKYKTKFHNKAMRITTVNKVCIIIFKVVIQTTKTWTAKVLQRRYKWIIT